MTATMCLSKEPLLHAARVKGVTAGKVNDQIVHLVIFQANSTLAAACCFTFFVLVCDVSDTRCQRREFVLESLAHALLSCLFFSAFVLHRTPLAPPNVYDPHRNECQQGEQCNERSWRIVKSPWHRSGQPRGAKRRRRRADSRVPGCVCWKRRCRRL